MSKFTKGEWTAQPQSNVDISSEYPIEIVSRDDNRFLWNICDIVGGLKGEEVESNANLIAAAPDLYRALDNAFVIRLGETLDQFKERYSKWYREERVPALKKARGEV